MVVSIHVVGKMNSKYNNDAWNVMKQYYLNPVHERRAETGRCLKPVANRNENKTETQQLKQTEMIPIINATTMV